MILYNIYISGSLTVENGIVGTISTSSYALSSSYALNGSSVSYTIYNDTSSLLADPPTNNLDIAYVTESFDHYLGIDSQWKNLQTLQSVVSASFDTRNMVLWLDASDSNVLTISASKIIGWKDKSPNNTSISFPSGKNPAYSSSFQNGLSAAYFDGTKMVMTDKLISNISMSAVFVVRHTQNVGGNNGEVITHNTGNGGTGGSTFNYCTIGADTTSARMYMGNGTTFSSYGSGSLLLNTNYIQSFVRGGQIGISYINAAQEFSSSATAHTATCSLSIADQGYRPLKGFLCEAIVYEMAITSSLRQQIETYLNNKWSIY